MIHIQTKRYQITLWAVADRGGIPQHAEFDKLEDAVRAFEANVTEGRYAEAIL